MKKVFALLIALLMFATLPLMAFATGETIPSPTDVPVVEVVFLSYHAGSAEEMFTEIVPLGESVSFEALASETHAFVGFSIEGAYDIVSGGEYIFTSAGVDAANGATLVITPKGDVKVSALYTPVDAPIETTRPTETTAPIVTTTNGDEGGDSSENDCDLTLLWIALAVIVGGAGCAIAAKKLFSKKEK